MVVPSRNGYLAMPYDSVDLANGIKWVIEKKIAMEL